MILDSNQVAFSSAGVANVQFGPPPYRRWRVRLVSISTGSDYLGIVPPQCTLYRNTPIPSNIIDATYSGQRNSTSAAFDLLPGETVLVRWTGGTSGDLASVILEGDDTDAALTLPPPPPGSAFANQILGTDTLPSRLTGVDVSAALYTRTLAATPSGTDTGVLDVRQWPVLSLFFSMPLAATFHQIDVQWYADKDGLAPIFGHQYRSIDSKPIIDSLVNEGPYVRLTLTFAGGASPSCIWFVRGRTSLAAGQGTSLASTSTEILHIDVVAIAAGAEVFTNFHFVQRGWATWTVIAGAVPFFFAIERLDQLGSFTLGDIARNELVAGQPTRPVQISLPGVLCRLRVINQAGAANVYAASVMLGPG